jgi:hypothetical protein
MISDLDIWRSTNALIKQHGDDAALIAAQRADELLAKGNIEGQRVFKKIVKAINELQKNQPGESDRVN